MLLRLVWLLEVNSVLLYILEITLVVFFFLSFLPSFRRTNFRNRLLETLARQRSIIFVKSAKADIFFPFFLVFLFFHFSYFAFPLFSYFLNPSVFLLGTANHGIEVIWKRNFFRGSNCRRFVRPAQSAKEKPGNHWIFRCRFSRLHIPAAMLFFRRGKRAV